MSGFGIGASLPRLEDARFLEGRGQFCADIALPGMLHAAFVRSPHAHARILVDPQASRDSAAQVLCRSSDLDRRRPGSDSTAKLAGLQAVRLARSWRPERCRHAGEPVVDGDWIDAGRGRGHRRRRSRSNSRQLPPVVTMADALKKMARLSSTTNGETTSSSTSSWRAAILPRAKAAAVHIVERSFRHEPDAPPVARGPRLPRVTTTAGSTSS